MHSAFQSFQFMPTFLKTIIFFGYIVEITQGGFWIGPDTPPPPNLKRKNLEFKGLGFKKDGPILE